MTEDATLKVIQDFGKLLGQGDEHERNAWIARAKMLGLQEASEDKFEPPIRTLGEYLDTPLEVPPVLVEPALLVRGGMLCTVARAGYGKTQMNLNRIMRWATGKPMFDGLTDKRDIPILGPSKPLKTLLIENEGAPGMFHRQLGIMLNAKGYLTPEERLLVRENVLVWGEGGWSGLKLDDPAQLDMIRAGCEKHQPDIVFIEPFRGLWKGDENSATEMAIVADALSDLAVTQDCGVIITHHERKSGVAEDGEKMSAGRGSTVLEGVVSTMENFEKAKGGDFREVSWSKVRYNGGHQIVPIRMEWQSGDWWYRHVAAQETEQALLNELADADPTPMTVRDLQEATDEKVHKIREVMKDLVDSDKVVKMQSTSDGSGSTGVRYRLKTTSRDEGMEI